MIQVKRHIFLHVTMDEYHRIMDLSIACQDPGSDLWTHEDRQEFYENHEHDRLTDPIWNETLWHREFTTIVGPHAADIIQENTCGGGGCSMNILTKRDFIAPDDRITNGPSIEHG